MWCACPRFVSYYPFKEQKLVVIGSEDTVFHDNLPWDSKVQHYAHKIHVGDDGVPVPSKTGVRNVSLMRKSPSDRI